MPSNKAKNLVVWVDPNDGGQELTLELIVPAVMLVGVALVPGTCRFVADGGTAPYDYSIVSGAGDLPDGYTVDAMTGIVTGTATTAGTDAFVAQVDDAGSLELLVAFKMVIQPNLFVIAGTPGAGEVGIDYLYRFIVRDASGTQVPSGFTVDTLPDGLSLDTDGATHGTPTTDGTTHSVVTVTYGGQSLSFDCVFTIYTALAFPLEQEFHVPAHGTGTFSLVATGGGPNVTYSPIPETPLPTWLGMSKQGTVKYQQIPALLTPYSFSVRVSDGFNTLIGIIDIIPDIANLAIGISKNGTPVGDAGSVVYDFVEGANVTIGVTNTGGVATVTIAAAGSSASGSIRARLASTAALPANTYSNGSSGLGATLTGNSNGAISTFDGSAPALNDILLVMNEAAPEHDGPYTVTQVGDGSHPYILTRHTSMDTTDEYAGGLISVGPEGTVNKNSLWQCTSSHPIVGTGAITFVKQNATPRIVQRGCGWSNGDLPLTSGTFADEVTITEAGSIILGQLIAPEAQTGSANVVVRRMTAGTYPGGTWVTLFTMVLSSGTYLSTGAVSYAVAKGDILQFVGSGFLTITALKALVDIQTS